MKLGGHIIVGISDAGIDTNLPERDRVDVFEAIVSRLVSGVMAQFVIKAGNSDTFKTLMGKPDLKITNDIAIAGLPFKILDFKENDQIRVSKEFVADLNETKKLLVVGENLTVTPEKLKFYNGIQESLMSLETMKPQLNASLESFSQFNEKNECVTALAHAYIYYIRNNPKTQKVPQLSLVLSSLTNSTTAPGVKTDKDTIVPYKTLSLLEYDFPNTVAALKEIPVLTCPSKVDDRELSKYTDNDFPKNLKMEKNKLIDDIQAILGKKKNTIESYKQALRETISTFLNETFKTDAFFANIRNQTPEELCDAFTDMRKKLQPFNKIEKIPCGIQAIANHELQYFKCDKDKRSTAIENEQVCINQFNPENNELLKNGGLTLTHKACRELPTSSTSEV